MTDDFGIFTRYLWVLAENFLKGGKRLRRRMKWKWDFIPQPVRESRERRKILSGVQGGAPAENEFGAFFGVTKHFWSSSGGTITAP